MKRDREKAMFARMGCCSSRKVKDWQSAAVKKFGTTSDFRSVGWVLPDGRALDFYAPNRGVLGHVQIGQIGSRGGLLTDVDNSAYNKIISDYVGRGGMRFALWLKGQRSDKDRLYLEYSAEKGLTSQQKEVVRGVLRKHPQIDLVAIDKINAAGKVVESKEIKNPDSSVSLRKKDVGWEDKAVKEFGTTEDFERVGWVLPDGRMLDFSMGSPDKEKEPHFNIARLNVKVETQFENEEQKYGAVLDPGKWNDMYCKLGGLRFNLSKEGESLYLEYNKKVGLTPAQKERVKEAIKKYPSTKTVFMELRGPAGRYVDSKTIHNPDSSISLRRLAFPLDALVKQAKAFKNFEDFSKLYSGDIYHGYYWHLTANPKFKVSEVVAPRDMSSMGSGEGSDKGAMMVTSDFDNWNNYYNGEGLKRPYAVLFDASDIDPEYLRQVGRGFGNEVFLPAAQAKKLRQVGVYPVKQAKVIERRFEKRIPDTKEKLYALWKEAQT